MHRRPGGEPPEIPLLRVTAGRDVLRFAVVGPEGVEMGRDESCALVLADASVSRRHARVIRVEDGFALEDLGSRNGTFVEGKAVKRQVIAPGARLEVGTVPVRFDLVTAEELSHLRSVVDRLAARDRDPLTGLLSRAYLDEQLPALLEGWAAAGTPVGVVFLDVDHFKAINDGFGHAIGDDVLRQVARLLAYAARERESCVRYGGEEIVVILEGADEARAAVVGERLRQVVEGHDWGRLAPGLSVTVSCGVAQRQDGEPIREWLDRADRALYKAKHKGRNCVKRASEGA